MPHTLQYLIDHNDVSPRVVALMQQQLVDELLMVDSNYIPTPDNIVISDDRRSVVLDNLPPMDSLPVTDYTPAIRAYGEILLKVLSMHPSKRLARIAHQCIDGTYTDFGEVNLALERRISNTIYIPMLIIIALLITLLAYLNANQ